MPGLHVDWFVDPRLYPVRYDLVLSARTLIALAGAVAALLALAGLQRALGDAHWPRSRLFGVMVHGAPTLLAAQSAITLIYSGVQPVLLAPHLQLPHDLAGYGAGAIEVLAGFALLSGIADRGAAVLVLAAAALAFVLEPPLDAIAQLHWAGIALVMWAMAGRRQAGGRPRSVAVLRVLTGIAIIAPALSEKIWNPAIGAAFLAQHPAFNLARHMLHLAWVTDDRFVLAAGVAELTIGVLLISGMLTRVVILAMWLPFNAGIPFLPPQELLWHLPILAVMYFLLVHGADRAPDTRDQPAA